MTWHPNMQGSFLFNGLPLYVGEDSTYLMYNRQMLDLSTFVKVGRNPPGYMHDHLDGTVSVYCREFMVRVSLTPLELIEYVRYMGPLPQVFTPALWGLPANGGIAFR